MCFTINITHNHYHHIYALHNWYNTPVGKLSYIYMAHTLLSLSCATLLQHLLHPLELRPDVVQRLQLQLAVQRMVHAEINHFPNPQRVIGPAAVRHLEYNRKIG
jgi:hypothetical protein